MIYIDIPIKEIRSYSNIRIKYEGVQDLMKSIKDNGLLQPIGLKELKTGGYLIVWGNRRLEACRKLGHKTISSVIFSDKDEEMTEEEFFIVNATENIQRSPNSLLELGRIVKILRKNMSESEIASRLAISKSKVKYALNELEKIPPKFRNKIRIMTSSEDKKGDIPMTSAITISRMSGLDSGQKEKLFQHVHKNDISSERIKSIGSLMKKGKSFEDSKRESDKYFLVYTAHFFVDKKKYEEIIKKETWTDFILRCLNNEIPDFAFKTAVR